MFHLIKRQLLMRKYSILEYRKCAENLQIIGLKTKTTPKIAYKTRLCEGKYMN